MDVWLIIAVGGALGGFVQGLSGFGFGLVSLAIWSWVMTPQVAVPVVVFGSLVGQLLAAGAMRDAMEWRRVMPFLLGGVLGVPAGLWALSSVNPLLFKFGVGLLLFAYCTAMLFIDRLPHIGRGGRVADAAVGWIGGAMSGFGGLPGPVPTLWCTLKGWPKQRQRVVFQTFNLFMHALTLTAFFVKGAITGEVARIFLIVGPVVLLPSYVGIRVYRRVSDASFKRLVLALLALSGVVLVVANGPLVWDIFVSNLVDNSS